MALKILLIWDRLGDYHRARAKALEAMGHTVLTADLAMRDNLYQWTTELMPKHYFLSSKSIDEADLFRRCIRFIRLVCTHHINVVGISGYSQPSYIVFMVLSRLLRVRVVMFAESWYKSSAQTEKLKQWFLLKYVHAFFVSGQRAYAHFDNLLGGKRSQEIAIGYSAVDNLHFSQRITLKRNLAEYPHLLCVARFAHEKNHKLLIEAFLSSQLARTHYLKMVGAGPLLDGLKLNYAKSQKLVFETWQAYEDLPSLYQQAEAFVLASTFEPWGLVVNEAMAAGLPILISEQCGCAPELARNNNSITFDANTLSQISNAFNTYAELSLQERKAMGKASQKVIDEFSVQAWAQQFSKLSV